MRTVGVGADKPSSNNDDELKKEIKNLKTTNTKLTKANEELAKKVDELTKVNEELTAQADQSKQE